MSEEVSKDDRQEATPSEGPQSVDVTRKRQGQELEEDASKMQKRDEDWLLGGEQERIGGKADIVVIGEEEQQDQQGSRVPAPKANESNIAMGNSGQKSTHHKRRKKDTKSGRGLQASSSSSSSSTSSTSSGTSSGSTSSSSSTSSLFGGRATRQTEAIAVEEEQEEDDDEVDRLLLILKSITGTSSLAGVTSTNPPGAKSTRRVHMFHLLDAVKAASVPRFRTDNGQGTPKSTFEKGVALVSDALAAPPNIVPTTAALRLASFLDQTLGWREHHLNSQSIDAQRRVKIYSDDEDLSAIFLCLVKVGAFDEP